jgi:hypothetical protein
MRDENAVGPLIRLLNNPGEEIMIRLVADALGKIAALRQTPLATSNSA